MSNDFNKEEVVAWEQICEGFEDSQVMSLNVSHYTTDSIMMARAGDTIWRPYPYRLPSYDGMDQSANFKPKTQLSVPATLGYEKSVPWIMDAKELRDALQENRLYDGAKRELSSVINTAILNTAALQGTLVVKRTSAASGFDDMAQCDAAMFEIGVPQFDHIAGLSSRDYLGMASNLASRQTMQGKPVTAYEKAYVGDISGFDTFKMDSIYRLPAAAGSGITIDTRDSANNYYIPQATSTAATGQRSNVDNRYQRATFSSTTGVQAGDCFTIANDYSVHMQTKQNTGQLKTYRVISVDSSTTMTISPPIISNQVASDAGTQYQNCVITTKASNSAVVFLNTVQAPANPFWYKDSIELMPGSYAVPENSGAAVMRFTTEKSKIQLVMQRFYDIDTMTIKYRVDCLFGVTMKNPEMAGIILFNQS